MSSSSSLNTAQFKTLEENAANIIQQIKNFDEAKCYKPVGKEPGDRYLDSKSIIARTKLYELAYKAPKGAHLHIHFNSCLGPNVLLDIAAEKAMAKNMYISTNIQGALTDRNLDSANIQFHFLATKQSKSLFDADYKGRKSAGDDVSKYDQMLFQNFLDSFESKIGKQNLPRHIVGAVKGGRSKELALKWLQQKLVFSASEVKYTTGTEETCKKQWAVFNARTQMMKGLFNYEYAYRRYTRLLLEEFVKENIQYAEIRPNFMNSNQVFMTANPNVKMDNFGIMDLIIDEYKKFKQNNTSFRGLKVIYCTPRVSKSDKRESVEDCVNHIEKSLAECLAMKKHTKYGPYVAGFDIIGAEKEPNPSPLAKFRSNPLSYFEPTLMAFQADCAKAKVRCPFLFHAGESHADPDHNLDVAMRLGSKRIAHGFCIPAKKPVREWAQRGKVCVECCPISNEILGLGPFIKDAAVYKLMAANIPCALASDNPTLFSSNLSYDFYQVMIGDSKFTLQKWRKLMRDSIMHAVWDSDKERDAEVKVWEGRYMKFVQEIVKQGPPKDDGTSSSVASEPRAQNTSNTPKLMTGRGSSTSVTKAPLVTPSPGQQAGHLPSSTVSMQRPGSSPNGQKNTGTQASNVAPNQKSGVPGLQTGTRTNKVAGPQRSGLPSTSLKTAARTNTSVLTQRPSTTSSRAGGSTDNGTAAPPGPAPEKRMAQK